MSSTKQISDIIRSTGNNLERKATAKFGNAVENFNRDRFRSQGPGAGQQTGFFPGQIESSKAWDASSYAAVLAGATEFRPKLKFLFKVEFFFATEIVAAMPELARTNYTFMIKTVDRPKVDFEYEDDVNQYNYRTKVLKKIKHRELTITFMDDVGNNVFDFFRSLMAIYSPITRSALSRDNEFNEKPRYDRFQTGSGMSFTGLDGIQTRNDADVAHRGDINTYAGNAITMIRVKQVFIDPTAPADGDKDKAISSNYYDFINPRLVSFDLDDLNHESSDPNLLTMQFDYDWLEMTKNRGIQSLSDGLGPEYSTVLASKNGEGPAGAPTDMLLNRSTGVSGSPVMERGKSNPFASILSSASRQVIQSVTKNSVERAVRGALGEGRISRSISRAVTGGLTDAVNGVTDRVGGLVSSSVNDVSRGLVSSIQQGASTAGARIRKSLLSDASTVGPDRPAARASSQTPVEIPQGD